MNEIRIIVEAQGLTEAINKLATAIHSNSASGVEIAHSGATQDNTPPFSVTSSAPVANTSVPGAMNTPTFTQTPPIAAPTEATATPSVAAIGAAGAALVEQGKMPQLMSLLTKYGIQAVTQLNGADPSVINAFVTDLRALGAKI